MAAAKKIRTIAGTSTSAAQTRTIATPLHHGDVQATIEQLQATVNELISKHNTHQHSALNAVPAVGLVDGSGAAATNLFTS